MPQTYLFTGNRIISSCLGREQIQRWANPQDGTSPNFWGRSIGWWFMAMVDVLDYIPDNHPGRASLISWIQGLAESLPNYQRDGLWYQVIDQPEREGNFPKHP